eukprot:6027932-Pleurochrysis_carterae.AAC.2
MRTFAPFPALELGELSLSQEGVVCIVFAVNEWMQALKYGDEIKPREQKFCRKGCKQAQPTMLPFESATLQVSPKPLLSM